MAKLSVLGNLILDDRATRHPVSDDAIADRASFRLGGPSFRIVAPESVATPAERALRIGRRVLRDAGPANHAIQIILALMILAFGIAGLSVFLFAAPALHGALCLLPALVFAWAMLADRRRARRDLASLPSLPPVCLACGYDLSGLTPDPDGCTICPECSAAWRLQPALGT